MSSDQSQTKEASASGRLTGASLGAVRGQRLGAAIAVVLLLGLLALPSGEREAAATSNAQPLSKGERALVAAAAADGDGQVRLLVAARRGQSREAAAAVGRLGGSVALRDADVDYLRVVLQAAEVETLLRDDTLDAVEIDVAVPLEDPDPGPAGFVHPTPQPAPGPDTPPVNPYLPTGDIGAAQFVEAHPTWDGRGTTIGILDTGIDLSHPALQTTSTRDRKVVDWFTATDPGAGDDPTWVAMDAQVTGPAFTLGNSTYTGPGVGTYRFGTFDERDPRLAENVDSDVNRDGNPAGSSGIFGVLWDTVTNDVWVDANQNRSFADEPAMTDYRIGHDVGAFGTDNPSTKVVERIPFVVQTDGRHKAVNIGMDLTAHGTHVAGIAAGSNLFGGPMDGAAPGAKLVAARVCVSNMSCPRHAIVEGAIALAKRRDVDIINASLGSLSPLNDGRNPIAVVWSRLSDQFKVQMFVSAGNQGPGANTVDSTSAVSNVVSVGSYVSSATWRSNYGSDSQFADNVHDFSATGPSEGGRLKPDVVAPGAAISAFTAWCGCGPIPGTFELPAGYAFQNGTSMAVPQAAGGAALLISAAKQAGVQHRPAQLRHALRSTARFLAPARIGAFRQGNGLLQVGAAWELLRQRPTPVEIEASVPVATALSEFLERPHTGVGIHDREGVVLGRPYARTYTFTRRSGGATAVKYRLSWMGNDGTFRGPGSVALPLNTPVRVDVDVNPSQPGAHSAVLHLDDPATPGIDHQTMNVVVVPHELDEANAWTVSREGVVGRNQSDRLYVRAPPGTPGLSVEFSGPSEEPGTGQARFLRYEPFGTPLDSTRFDACYLPTFTYHTPSGQLRTGSCGTPSTPRTPRSAVATYPAPGVWEVTVDGARSSDAAAVPWSLEVSLLGATVSPDPDVVAAAPPGTTLTRAYTVTNRFGAFTGRLSGTIFGSGRRLRPSITDQEKQRYEVEVEPASTSLRAVIGSASGPDVDLDLFVFDCTSGTCTRAGVSADADAAEAVRINDPAPGRWVIVVDAYAVPAGATTYDYLDVFTHPAFGSITVADADAAHPAAPAAWTAMADAVTGATAPAPPREIFGNVEVRTDADQVIGSGEVVVERFTG